MRAHPSLWRAALLAGAACLGAPMAGAGQEAGSLPPRSRPGDPIPSLAMAYRGQFLVGAAVTREMVLSNETRRFLEHQFDVIVAENEMKPSALSRGEGRYDFAAGDALVDWANQHGIRVRGHCLVWHREEPAWMFAGDGKPLSRDLLVRRMRAYIHDVVGHFKGRVWAWDVVNEAFVVSEPGVPNDNGWRRSTWYDVIGPSYVALAFQAAREADPDALLFYNDYETQDPAKRSLILDLVRSLKEGGVAIDGIGHQSHYTLDYPPVKSLEASIEEVARLGLKNHITEMDISMRERWNGPVPPLTDALRAAQALRWAEFFRMFRRNADKIEAVVTWGVNDEVSWLRPPDEPLLFKAFRPTGAFWAVLDEATKAGE